MKLNYVSQSALPLTVGDGESKGREGDRERGGKSQRRLVKAACVSLIFTLAVTFTSRRG